MAHRLLTVGWEVSGRELAALLGGASVAALRLSYVDFVPRLRQMAAECMQTQMNSANAQIDLMLRGTRLANCARGIVTMNVTMINSPLFS